LLAPFGSDVVEMTLALFEISVPLAVADGTASVSVKLAAAPFASTGVEQVIGPVPPAGGVMQFQPAGAASEVNVVFGGVVSLSVTVCASDGPAFETAIV
jgi:hypothetical protein